MINLPNKQQVIDYLNRQFEELQDAGYVPTIELVIEDLERQIETEEHFKKEDKKYIPEGAEADYEDYSGATEGDR
jgi:hypothetical protein